MDRSPVARSALRSMIDGYCASQVVCIAAELGLPDLVKGGASSCTDLAARTAADPTALRRLLRALCGLGVFDRVAPDGVALNDVSELLLRDAPSSLNPWARLVLDQSYASWGALRECVMTGRTGFESVHGVDAWTHRGRNPASGRLFNDAMASLALEISEAVLGVYDFSAFASVVDVGGGSGTLAAALLRACPRLRVTVLDASVLEPPLADSHTGINFVRGNFLRAVPAGGDCYILSRVLHDWDDASAVRILRNVAIAMPATGSLLVLERVLPSEDAMLEAALSDLHMMVMNGGRERTLDEFRDLFAAAGLDLARVLPTASIVSLMLSIRR